MSVFALDFDGVLCDSARETGITGWKAATTLWEDIVGALPPRPLLERYCRARPVIETGYQAILMMRLLKDGEDPEKLLETFPHRIHEVVEKSGTDPAGLKRLYAAVRDRWLQTDPQEWLSLSPLYPGTRQVLNALPPGTDCYIVTTKQERFVVRLLAHNGVRFDAGHIFGLDRGMSKEAVVHRLVAHHPGHSIHLVEDRLATLKRFLARPDLAAVRLHLACWGHNTEAERREAMGLKIHLLTALRACLAYDCSTAESRRPVRFPARFR